MVSPREVGAVAQDGGGVGHATVARVDPEAGLGEGGEGLPLRRQLGAAQVAHVVGEEIERPASGDGGILLPERAGGGVARVCEPGLASRFESWVQAQCRIGMVEFRGLMPGTRTLPQRAGGGVAPPGAPAPQTPCISRVVSAAFAAGSPTRTRGVATATRTKSWL
jgi:hypothetical protein